MMIPPFPQLESMGLRVYLISHIKCLADIHFLLFLLYPISLCQAAAKAE